jgi:hypothetical protein
MSLLPLDVYRSWVYPGTIGGQRSHVSVVVGMIRFSVWRLIISPTTVCDSSARARPQGESFSRVHARPGDDAGVVSTVLGR